MFLHFIRGQLTFWLNVSVWYFKSIITWVVSLLAGNRPMSVQFQKVYFPPRLPLIHRFPWKFQSKALDHLVSVHLGWFIEYNKSINQTIHLAQGNQRFCTCDTLLDVSPSLETALERGKELLDWLRTAAFERVNNQGIISKHCSVDIESSVLFTSALTVFGSTCRGGRLSEQTS